ncbi:MAG: aminoacyl-tRNA hydrolase [Bacillota bacterium]|jgi:PTH1 family peptidyl-tRNA hydrolase|nr:aminoacyl-tRNA hydrolase [Bacillota bacterium]
MNLMILGLGNPGPRYLLTRHNVGFRAVDKLSTVYKIPLYKTGCHSFWGKGNIEGREVILAKPMTYMNKSGLAAVSLLDNFKLEPSSLLVIYDDIDLPFGTLRLRPGGGSGGHKGMESLLYYLQTDCFPRLRIGIGRPPEDVVRHVLTEFLPAEEEILETVLADVVKAVSLFLQEGLNAAMNIFNRKPEK